jgi:uncharacterized membrane protein
VANGQAHQMVLFSAFLLWAVLSFRSARKRDRLALLRLEEQGLPPEPKAPVSKAANGLVLAIGTIAWMVFMAWGHKWLIGVSPFAINLGT